MKKRAVLFFLFISVISSTAFGDVFASRIRLTNPDGSKFDGNFKDGTAAKIWYYLNDTATAVVVRILDASTGTTVATINAANKGRSSNPNSVSWDGTGSRTNGKYYVSISATGPVYSNTKYVGFYFQNTSAVGTISRGIYTRGVDANIDMASPNFGYWYASNSDPGNDAGYRQGTLRYNPDGSFAGTNAGHPILLNTLGTANAGTFNWGTSAPWTSALDSKGRIYQVSNGTGFITRMDNDSAAPKIIKSNVLNPRGIYAVGSGAALKLYIAADTVVWRADIGNDDTVKTPLVMVGQFNAYVRDVILDDAGFMIVTLRSTAAGIAPGYVERYNISGTLPVKRADALFSVSYATGLPVCMALKHGANKTSAADDTLYFVNRGTNAADSLTYGVHQLVNIDGFFPDAKQIYKSGDYGVPPSLGGNNNASADIALDWAGNIIWFENSNEEIFMISTPRAGTSVTNTTRGYDSATVTVSLSVGDDKMVPAEFFVHQNYPNPFNPSTTISYQLPASGFVNVTVYDLLGNMVKELYNNRSESGYSAVIWDATNNQFEKVSSGMYLYKVTAQLNDGRVFTSSKRMVLLK